MVEKPHKMYPLQISAFRLPSISESAPISSVVSVAVAALAATMAASLSHIKPLEHVKGKLLMLLIRRKHAL